MWQRSFTKADWDLGHIFGAFVAQIGLRYGDGGVWILRNGTTPIYIYIYIVGRYNYLNVYLDNKVQ